MKKKKAIVPQLLSRINKGNNLVIQEYNGIKELNKAAAGLFTELARTAVKAKKYFSVFLSGGNTPKEIYKLLASPAYSEKIPWEKTFIFWGDERYVPADSEMNNSHMAFDALLKHVPVPPFNIFPIPTSLSPERSAETYDELLHRFLNEHPHPIDLILLGLGTNGHTASLFPNTPVLHENVRWVKEVFIPELNMYRITLTAHFINKAFNIVFIVSGKDKSKVFAEITGDNYEPERLPAQLIKPEKGNLYWLIDREAGSTP